jgi:hypothetical protein
MVSIGASVPAYYPGNVFETFAAIFGKDSGDFIESKHLRVSVSAAVALRVHESK